MSKKGHVPVRMCVACRERKTKDEMVRFTRGPGGVVRCEKGPFTGRGFYVCPDVKCFKIAKKRVPDLAALEMERND